MREGFLYFTDTGLTAIGLIIFFSWFVVMSLRVFKTSKSHYSEMSQLPLRDEVSNGE
jgi:cytochrome c oxidase cbb3-type subunit 4